MPATRTPRLIGALSWSPAARPRRDGSSRNRPCHSCSSAAGSSSRVTATCSAVDVVEDRRPPSPTGRPGTCPGRRRAGTGAAGPRVPLPTSTPAIDTQSVQGSTRRRRRGSRPGSHHGTRLAGAQARTERRHRAVQRAPTSRARMASQRSMMARGARVGGAGLALLVVGQRQHAQREDLVDLGGVEHVARALGRDRRVVVEDDRRRQHQSRRRPRRRPAPGRCRCCAQRRPPRRANSGGSSSETNAPVVDRQEEVHGDQRVAHHHRRGAPVATARPSCSRPRTAQLDAAGRPSEPRRQRCETRRRPASARARSGRRDRSRRRRLAPRATAGRPRTDDRCAGRPSPTVEPGTSTSCSTASSKSTYTVPSIVERVDRLEARRRRHASTVRACDLQEAQPDVTAAPAPASTRHLGLLLATARRRPPRRTLAARARRTASAAGSSRDDARYG